MIAIAYRCSRIAITGISYFLSYIRTTIRYYGHILHSNGQFWTRGSIVLAAVYCCILHE